MNDSRSSLVTFDGDDSGDDESFLKTAHLDAENKAEITKKMGEVKKLVDELIMKLKDHDLKVDKFIKFLKTKKEAVDKSYRRQNAAVTVFSGISATGGIGILVGSAGAVVTAGASFPLVIAGGIAVGIGTFGSITTQLFSKYHRWLIIQKCKEESRNIESDTEEIGTIYKKLCSKCTEVCGVLGLTIPSFFESSKLIGNQSILNAAVIPGKAAEVSFRLVRFSNLLVKVSDTFHLKFVGRAMIPTLKITEAILRFGAAITGIGICIDLYVGGKVLYDLVKGKQCAEFKTIDLAINKAENHAKLVNSYLQFLQHHPEGLFPKVIEPTIATRQIAYQTE